LRSSGDNVALPEKSDKREAFRFSKVSIFSMGCGIELERSFSRRITSSYVRNLIVMILVYPEAVYSTSKHARVYPSEWIFLTTKKVRDILFERNMEDTRALKGSIMTL
jgi:hypothetical protein